MFEKQLAKAKEKGYTSALIRRDVVRRIIERGDYVRLVCRHYHTDDYAWDAKNGFGKGELSREEAMEVIKRHLTSSHCRCYVDVERPGVVEIIPFLNLAYELVVKESQSESPRREVSDPSERQATRRQKEALHELTGYDTREWELSVSQARKLMIKAKEGEDITTDLEKLGLIPAPGKQEKARQSGTLTSPKKKGSMKSIPHLVMLEGFPDYSNGIVH